MMVLEDKVLDFNKIIPTLGEVFRARFTGALRLDSDAGTRVFYLRDGDLISIGTTIDKEKIDEILIRDGKLTKEHIKEALEKSNSFAQIGKQLISFGFLKREELEEELKKQANFVLYNVIKEGSGKISFIEGHEPTRTDVFNYPTHLWLLDFIMGIEERETIFKLLPPLNHFIGKEPEMEEFLNLLPWDEEDKSLAMKLNGSFTVAEATSYSQKKEMDVYKKLAYLNSFGVIKDLGEAQKKPAQAPLFSPLEVQQEVFKPTPPVEFPPIRRHKDKRKKIFYVYPLIGSAIVIIFFAIIFLYYGWLSKPKKVPETKPILVEEKKTEGKIEEESETMVLTPKKEVPPQKNIEEKKEIPKEEINVSPKNDKEKKEMPKEKAEPIKKEIPKEEIKKEIKEEAIPAKKAESEKKEIVGSPLEKEAYNFLQEAKTSPQSNYTIQILIACQEETIIKAKNEYPDLNFWFIPIYFKGKNCYKLFYDKFKSKEEALNKKNNLPESLLKNNPQVVSFSQALKDSRER